MKYLDMYGQPIQFKYKNSAYFATTCGLIASIIVVIIIIVYIVLYIIDVAEMSVPIVLNVPINQYPSPRYEFIPDYNGYFDSNSDMPNLNADKPYTGYLQLAFCVRNRIENKWTALTSTNLVIEVENTIKTKDANGIQNVQLFYDKCERIGYLNENIYKKMNLNEVYCIYTPFTLNRDTLDENEYGIVDIKVKKLTKGCHVMKVSDLDSYKTFKSKVNVTKTFPKEEHNWSAFVNNNGDDQCGDGTFDVNNYDFYFMYLNTLVNETQIDNTIQHYLDWKQIEMNDQLKSSVSVFFQKNKLTSFKTVIPKSLSNKNTTEYYVSFDNDKYSNTPSNVNTGSDSDSNHILEITIKSSDRINQPERTYTSLFDILGKIGGLSKIIILIGGLFVMYSSSMRLKESLVNDFYTVIDPINNDKVNKDFIEYINEIHNSDNDHNNNNNEGNAIITDMQSKENELKCFFKPKAEKILSVYNDLNGNNVSMKDKGMFYISKIVYYLSVKSIYSGLHYTTCELTLNFFCCCCVNKQLKRKNKVFNKAVKALHKDTDFVSILECVQNFESIKEIFLQRETQFALFKALANKPFYIDDNKKRKIESKHHQHELTNNEDAFKRSIENVYNNLLILLNDSTHKEEIELDRGLVLNLLDKNEKEDGKRFMDIVERLIEKRNKDKMMKENNENVNNDYTITRDDIEKLNKRFHKY